ncbi:MAG: DUF1700 domain-containing protein [Lachnospiraceae bacterium]|nr:DUF1700 domain-containing protein [Lachnospiraceae bacterium]
MDKKAFVQELRRSLTGKIPQDAMERHVRYYEDYIDIRERTGDLPEELMEKLGDPRLLAKTIIVSENAGGAKLQSSQPLILKAITSLQKMLSDFWKGLA